MNRKSRGELSEIAFLHKATGLGFHVSKPYGDSSRYDFIVEHLGHLSKIQVKSTACLHRCGGYVACLHNSTASRMYSAIDVDFFAVHVIPEDAWYIIPFELAESGIYLNPRKPGRDRRFGPYREAWHLFEGFSKPADIRFTINIDACAADAWPDCSFGGARLQACRPDDEKRRLQPLREFDHAVGMTGR